MAFHAWLIFLGLFHQCHQGVQCLHNIIYSPTQVCGLQGASVVLSCSYEYSLVGSYMAGEWYNERNGRATNLKYNYPDCSLNIDTLSNDHVGVYYFRFYATLYRSWITSDYGLNLSVTDLQVREDTVVGRQNQTKVTCSTSCSLGSQYVWYKNGELVQDKTTASILLDSTTASEEGSYSCSVKGYEAQRSPAVCVPAKQCWGVTYSSPTICVLLGSSVDIPCTYKYPRDHSIKTTFWFNKLKSLNQHKDLSLDKEHMNHMEYLGNKENNNCTLKLKDIRESHSGEYGFRFITEKGKDYTGLPGVTITVMYLQMLIPNLVKEGERVTLTCNTTCILPDLTFVWYKNGQPVTKQHTTQDKLHLNPVSSEDTGNYSCGVKGYGLSSTPRLLNVKYKPKTVSVSVSPGETEEGSSVTLSCSSDANPPVHNYTWYMRSGAESLVRGTGENISFNVTSDTSGLYYCEAQNEVGSQNSTEVSVSTGDFPDTVTKSGIFILTLIPLSVLFAALSIYKVTRRNITTERQAMHSGVHDDTCTAVSPEDEPPEYENLQGTAQDSLYQNLPRSKMSHTKMELRDLSMRTPTTMAKLSQPVT